MAIAQELTDYFNASGLAQMRQDLQIHPLYVATERAQVLGFATVQQKSRAVAEITWLAVTRACQHRGIGSQLIDTLAGDLRAQGVQLLEVKTLAAKADYAPYEPTRRFYEKNDFVHLETIDPYPGWENGNPCAIYVKIL